MLNAFSGGIYFLLDFQQQNIGKQKQLLPCHDCHVPIMCSRKVLKHGFDHQMIHADAWSKLKATKCHGCRVDSLRGFPFRSRGLVGFVFFIFISLLQLL